MRFGNEAWPGAGPLSRVMAVVRKLGPRGGVWTLALVIAASLAFRLHVAASCSLWIDEAITRRGLGQPWIELLKGPSETHPPLMYWLARSGIALFGDDDLGLRAVSLGFGCVLLAAVYELCLEFGLSIRRALLVVATLAMNPFFIRHATEARHYAILAAFVTLATTRALRGLRAEARARDLLGFAAAALAAGATHYSGVAYAMALLAALVLGAGLRFKQSRPPRLRMQVGVLLGLLVALGFLASRAVALGRDYGVGAGAAPSRSLYDTELLLQILREFSQLASNVQWAYFVQPVFALIGLALLSLRQRGVARLIPLGIGLVPCLSLPFVSADHFIAARYVAPSIVFYHLGGCFALFATAERAAAEIAPASRVPWLAPLVSVLMLGSLCSARAREFPSGFGAGADDYRSLQRYFIANLARDTKLVSYVGGFGGLMFGKIYPIGSRPLSLERLVPLQGTERYLVIEIHADGPDRRAEFQELLEDHLGVTPEQWQALPRLSLPHSVYQQPVPARLVLLSKHRKLELRRRIARERLKALSIPRAQ
jgi:hypothetical protein